MSNNKPGSFDFDEYAALTRDCLETLDTEDIPVSQIEESSDDLIVPRRFGSLFRKPPFLVLVTLLSVNLLVLGFYNGEQEGTLNQQEAVEQLQATFLSDYELIAATDSFLATTDVVENPRERRFIDELNNFNAALAIEEDSPKFEIEGFRFLNDSVIYIEHSR